MAGIVALDAGIFAYEGALAATGPRDAFVNAFALVPFNAMHGIGVPPGPPAVATLLTYQFLHASAAHVVVNMLFLAAFGPEVESLLGSLRFLAFYLFCGVAGGIAQISVDPGSYVPEIGASGAIAGVLGAYILRFPHRHFFGGVPAFAIIGIWAGLQFVHGFGALSTTVLSERGGGTAYFAHIGGFLAGVFAIGLFARPAALRGGRHE